MECAKKGLEPVEITQENIKMLRKYINDIGVYTVERSVIPLGYDYGCESDNCKMEYRSFNRKESPLLTEVFKSWINPQNTNGKNFGKDDKGNFLEAVGFGLSKNDVFSFKFDRKIPIKGIICSSNPTEKQKEMDFIELDCNSLFKGNLELEEAGSSTTLVNFL